MRHLFTLLLSLALCASASAQTIQLAPVSINSAGGTVQAGNLSLSWSVGQVVYQTRQAGNLALTEGFQQPKALLVSTPEPLPRTLQQGLTLYPNPTYGQLTLEATFASAGTTDITIVDMAGRLVRRVNPVSTQSPDFYTELNVDDLSAGLYMLRVQHQPENGPAEPVRHIRFQVQR